MEKESRMEMTEILTILNKRIELLNLAVDANKRYIRSQRNKSYRVRTTGVCASASARKGFFTDRTQELQLTIHLITGNVSETEYLNSQINE